MGSFGDYLENATIDHIFGVSVYTPPQTWIALSTADPTDSASVLTEPVGNAYARVDYGDWSAAALRAVENNATITFPTASGAWGTITHYAIMDASTAGNMLCHGSFTTPKSVVTSNTPSINASEIIISFNDSDSVIQGFTDYLAHAILDHVFENATYTPPTIHVALSTTQPVDAGTSFTEPSGNNYARVAYSSWDTAALGTTENTTDINFPTPTGTWGLITNSAICDAITVGNLLMFGDVTEQTPENGDPVKFPAGDLTITLT